MKMRQQIESRVLTWDSNDVCSGWQSVSIQRTYYIAESRDGVAFKNQISDCGEIKSLVPVFSVCNNMQDFGGIFIFIRQ